MKKLWAVGLATIVASTSAFANDAFIQKQYPKKLGSCRIMDMVDGGDNHICLEKVISKDFRKSGDNLYYIVLGNTERESCHGCGGKVDLYAITPNGKMIKSKDIYLGSWGYAPVEWKFSKQKNDKIALVTKTCFTNGGYTECSKHIFSVVGNKFKGISKISK